MPNANRAIPLAWLAASAALLGGQAHGQSITVDGRLGPAQTLAGPNYAIGAALGRQVGGNLFHSFGAFGLKGGETATFSGPAGVGHVIGRVTGGAASSINGTIRSTIPGASLYLVNPAGVVFGPSARVDVGGSFHASSADYLRLRDGARFGATNPDASTLTAAPPEAFGFLSAPRPITVTGSTLQPSQGGTLGLVGGDVTISGGVLLAPGGTVHVASAAGRGEVPVDPRAGPAPTVARSGRVQVANASTIYPSGGSVFIRAGELSVSDEQTTIVTDNSIPGRNGVLSLHADRAVAIRSKAVVVASATGPGRAPGVSIGTAAGGTVTVDSATVATNAPASGNGGPVAINTGALILQNGAVVVSNATNRGNGGPISVTANSVLLDGLDTRIESRTRGTGLADANGGPASAGTGGTISLTGGTLGVQNRASIEAITSGSGPAGSIGIAMTGGVAVTDGAQIMSNSDTGGLAATAKGGDAGAITLGAGTLTLARGGLIASDTLGSGNGGEIALTVGGALTIDGANKGDFRNGVSSEAVIGVSGSTGPVRVSAGSVSILNGGFISSNTFGTGRGNSVAVTTPGALVLDGGGLGGGATQIGASALGPQSGDAGTVSVSAGTVAVQNGAQVATATNGTGGGGGVAVNTGALTLARGGVITSGTFGAGNGGEIALTVGGALTIDGTNKGDFRNGVSSEAAPGSSGSAGAVRVNAGSVSLRHDGFINSNTSGAGMGGSVMVTTPGALVLDGGGGGFTEIAASAQGPQSGDAGTVTVSAGTAAVQNGGRIASSTAGPGRGGDVTVNAGALALARGGVITSDTFGAGNGGEIALTVRNALTIDGVNKGGLRNGVSSEAAPGSSGSAGSVRVSAGSLSVLNGGTITSSTAGTGRGGAVQVTTPGALLLDGGRAEVFTGITASATGAQSGDAGTVTVNAGTVTVQGGAQVASATTGPGRGGDVGVTAGSVVRLNGPGPQVSAVSTGTGDAGSVAMAAPQVVLRDGASISTAALEANGGNITVGLGDLLYLQQSAITTSVGGALGNGGNIAAAPQLVVLDRSVIQANAVGGNGGNVSVQASQLVQSFDSAITATSQRGVSGEILVAAQPLNLNGSLVVLAGELRAAAALLREGCAVRGASPRSSLVAAGRGGQRQGLEATLPALYFARRPVRDGEQSAPDAPAAPERISLGLSSPCG